MGIKLTIDCGMIYVDNFYTNASLYKYVPAWYSLVKKSGYTYCYGEYMHSVEALRYEFRTSLNKICDSHTIDA